MGDSYENCEYLEQGPMDQRSYNTLPRCEGDRRMIDVPIGDTGESVYEEVAALPNLSVMENVSAMAYALKDAEEDVTNFEQMLKDAKTRLQTVKDTLTEYYKSLGISRLTLETGEEVSIEEKLTCSQGKDENALKVFYRWLEQHDGGYLIKKKLEVEELNAAFTDSLKSLGYVEGKDFMVKEAVNTASLKSYLSEKLGRKSSVASIAVADVPSVAGLYIYNEVKIKGEKK